MSSDGSDCPVSLTGSIEILIGTLWVTFVKFPDALDGGINEN